MRLITMEIVRRERRQRIRHRLLESLFIAIGVGQWIAIIACEVHFASK